MNRITIFLLFIINSVASLAQDVSVAGMYPIDNCGRKVWNFNPDWRFHLGDVEGAEQKDFDDSSWEIISTPHTVKLMPAEDSGCRNYQGVAWYRKSFIVPDGNGMFILHFEAIMGKQKIYVNGNLVKEHFGGYLPVNINLTEAGVKAGDECSVAVMADNSDDKSYPPGKSQMALDFCYHGGIYRDVWLIERPKVFITDAIDGERQTGENGGKVASNGIFIHYANISDKSAEVYVNTTLCNSLSVQQTVSLYSILTDAQGRKVKAWKTNVTIPAKSTKVVEQGSKISNPHLWSPESPYLYSLMTKVIPSKSKIPELSLAGKDDCLDGGMTKVGIRSFEFRGKDGFWLNGKRYRQFVGANRHQDFAYVGNAVPNSQQRRDVQRLKDAGFNIIRTAHYPQDPAFMDACDELGIFVIVATPGWQFWNKESSFAEHVHQNTRDIIRRDRNHPCVLMWEPILNETRYPKDFALQALNITKEEYPYPYRPVAAADLHSAGVLENYDVVYAWPGDDEKVGQKDNDGNLTAEARAIELNKNMFTREFGEYVDDWYAHNNLNRASRSWGEIPQLMQALSLSNTTCDQHRTTGLFLGGCQWHPFDHQRGYHPDPYWGGIYDAFRQKKTAYYMFHSQIPVSDFDGSVCLSQGENTHGAFVHIANCMTQFSPEDVTVFSNCDSVRLSFLGEYSWTLPVRHEKVMCDQGSDEVVSLNGSLTNDSMMPYNAPVVFKNAWNFWKARDASYKQRDWQEVKLVAEGYLNGSLACVDTVMPSRRSTKLRLYADEMGRNLIADGSDFIVVVCEVTDDSGNVRRLAKDEIKFTVTGPAEIVGDGTNIGANPRQLEWGSAPVLVRSTREAGDIHIHADVASPGTHTPTPADLTIKSVPASIPFCLVSQNKKMSNESLVTTATSDEVSATTASKSDLGKKLSDSEKQRLLDEVQDQQADFGIVTP